MLPENCEQLVVTISKDWDSTRGDLLFFEKEGDHWKKTSLFFPVRFGENGLIWANEKCEGDRKSPAGIFSLGTVFGDSAHQVFSKNMPYLLITESLECVDDPKSIHYNCFVNSENVKDWNSSEKMREIGKAYSLGLVINHNVNPIIPKRGSCIFMHIGDEPTMGCTALCEKDLIELISLLSWDKNPHLVQMPVNELNPFVGGGKEIGKLP